MFSGEEHNIGEEIIDLQETNRYFCWILISDTKVCSKLEKLRLPKTTTLENCKYSMLGIDITTETDTQKHSITVSI